MNTAEVDNGKEEDDSDVSKNLLEASKGKC